MIDFLVSLNIISKEILEDYRKYYLEGEFKNKPVIHWGIEYEINFMDKEFPLAHGLLPRRYTELTLKPDVEPTEEMIIKEVIQRGSKPSSAKGMEVMRSWGNAPAPKKTTEEEVDILKKTVWIDDDPDDPKRRPREDPPKEGQEAEKPKRKRRNKEADTTQEPSNKVKKAKIKRKRG